MIKKTQGIVLNHIKYKESSIIVRIFTQEFGLQSYIVNGIRSARSKGKIALFQPLTLLDLVVYYKPEKDLNRISEYKCLYPFRTIPFDIRKTAIAIFLGELISKSLKAQEQEYDLFDFVANSVVTLDQLEDNFENLHLKFLYRLSNYLGIKPEKIEDISAQVNDSTYYKSSLKLTLSDLEVFEKVVVQEYDQPFSLSSSQRTAFLMLLKEYYQLHIDGFGNLNSLKILNDVFH